jgi:hypothetical protein
LLSGIFETTWQYVTINGTKGNKIQETDGRIENQLLSQTMALWFNSQNNPTLKDLPIEHSFLVTADALECGEQWAMPYSTQYYIIPQTVIDLLNSEYNGSGGATVGNLIDLANRYLGADPTVVLTTASGGGNKRRLSESYSGIDASLSDVTKAVDAFNRGFDNCRIFIEYVQNEPSSTSTLGGRSISTYVPKFGGTTDVEEYTNADESPFGILTYAYPNPFMSSTNIRFALKEQSKTRVEVYSISGELIQVLFDDVAEAGKEYKLEFDASNSNTSMYLYQIITEKGAKSGKLISVRE